MLVLPATGRNDQPAWRGQQLLTAEGLWTEVSGLRAALNDKTYRTWFSEAEGPRLVRRVVHTHGPERLHAGSGSSHFLGLINAAVRDATGHERRIDSRSATSRATARAPSLTSRSANPRVEGLNGKYNFDSFVIGSSNRFAHAAALAIAEGAGPGVQPAVHLREHRARQGAPPPGDRPLHRRALARSLRCYVTSERFMNDINSLRDKRIEGFKQRYRTLCPPDRRHPVPRAQGADPGGSSTRSARSTKPLSRS